MSKELPYFRFNCSEWLTGNIIFESYEMQGAFIRLCAELWNRNNELSIVDAYKRINNKKILDKKNYYTRVLHLYKFNFSIL